MSRLRPTYLRATSHIWLKAKRPLDSKMGKGRDCPSLLHIIRWTLKGQKIWSWVKSWQLFLHGKLLITFHDLSEPVSGMAQILVDHVGGIAFGWESRALTITRWRPLAHVRSGPYSSFFFISFHKLRILGSCNNNAHNPRSPMWVLLGSFFMSSKLMPGRFTRQILWCISKSKSKHQHKLDFPWSTYGVHKCTFVDSLDEYTGSSNHIYSLSNVE